MLSRAAWSAAWVPGQSWLYRETLSLKTKNKQKQAYKNLSSCTLIPEMFSDYITSLIYIYIWDIYDIDIDIMIF